MSDPPLLDYKCPGSNFPFLLTYLFIFVFKSNLWHLAIVDMFCQRQTIDILTGFVQKLYFHKFRISRTYRTLFLGRRLFSLYEQVTFLTNNHCGRNHCNFWVVPLSKGVLDIPVFCGEKKKELGRQGQDYLKGIQTTIRQNQFRCTERCHSSVGTSVQWVGDRWLHQTAWDGFPTGVRAFVTTGMGEQWWTDKPREVPFNG